MKISLLFLLPVLPGVQSQDDAIREELLLREKLLSSLETFPGSSEPPAAYDGLMVKVGVTMNRAGDKVCKVSDEHELHSAIAMSTCTVIEFEGDIPLVDTPTLSISNMQLFIDG